MTTAAGKYGQRWLHGMIAIAGALACSSCVDHTVYASNATATGIDYATARHRTDAAFEKWEQHCLITETDRKSGPRGVTYRFTPTGPEGDAALADWGMSPLFATLGSATRGQGSTLAVGSWGSHRMLFGARPHQDPAATAWKEKIEAVIDGAPAIAPPVVRAKPKGKGKAVRHRSHAKPGVAGG